MGSNVPGRSRPQRVESAPSTELLKRLAEDKRVQDETEKKFEEAQRLHFENSRNLKRLEKEHAELKAQFERLLEALRNGKPVPMEKPIR
jgi:dsDNA-specific endonuclease/ATPase MutS2